MTTLELKLNYIKMFYKNNSMFIRIQNNKTIIFYENFNNNNSYLYIMLYY